MLPQGDHLISEQLERLVKINMNIKHFSNFFAFLHLDHIIIVIYLLRADLQQDKYYFRFIEV